MKPNTKLQIGVIGMAPLVAAVMLIILPELSASQDIATWKRLALAGFVIFSYCFGLVKWAFPNG